MDSKTPSFLKARSCVVNRNKDIDEGKERKRRQSAHGIRGSREQHNNIHMIRYIRKSKKKPHIKSSWSNYVIVTPIAFIFINSLTIFPKLLQYLVLQNSNLALYKNGKSKSYTFFFNNLSARSTVTNWKIKGKLYNWICLCRILQFTFGHIGISLGS